jgi:IS5 family transposase
MIRYNSPYQLRISSFTTPFEEHLLPDNRWVILAGVLPWEELTKVYHAQMSSTKGRSSLPARLVIGALILKHMLKLDDREVLATLQENIYLQYFVGFSSFNPQQAFDPSLLVTIRKRMGKDAFDKLSLLVIKKIEEISMSQNEAIGAKKNAKEESKNSSESIEMATKTAGEKGVKQEEKKVIPIALQDTLIIDTTVAEQKIKYPTDLDLLDKVRTFSERMIDDFYELSGLTIKPRTYRNIARKDYLNAALKRKKSGKEIRKAIKKQLNYVHRNINTIKDLWNVLDEKNIEIPLSDVLRKKWVTCQEIYRQQEEMVRLNVKYCADRIVSIEQPDVRPILRGKANKKIEFGAKVALSVVNGTNRVFRISWDAYNDGIDLKGQVKAFFEQYGKYPKLVLADKIYMTNENRKFLKNLNIEHRGEPLGRKPKDQNGNLKKPYSKLQRKEGNQRNHVEGQFGTAKEAYGLNKVKAKTVATAESWIANIFFILNIVKLLKVARIAMRDNFYAFIQIINILHRFVFNLFFKNKKFINI